MTTTPDEHRGAGFRNERRARGEVARTVAIHQPNLLPWLGFFDKLRRCDVFVLLDNVQFSKGSRTNRTQVLVSGSARWITAPVRRSTADAPIRDVLVDEQRDWRATIVKTLRASYGRAPGFAASMPLLEGLLGYRSPRLADYNEHAIRRLAAELDLTRAGILRASELEVSGRSTGLLVDIVRAVGGTAYLVGGGAEGYQDDEAFSRAGIQVVAQNFEQRPYDQGRDGFVGGLSIVDALMHAGPDGARALLGARART